MRRFFKTSFSLSLVASAVLAAAQQQFSTSTANGTSGSVSAAPSGTSSFVGLSGSAAGATIGYSVPSGGGPPSDPPPDEAKFNTGGDSGPTGRTFNGASGGTGDGYAASQGSSSVTSGSQNYYSANFSQTAGDGGTPSGTGGGTYDPWPIYNGDLNGYGASADLYFQAGLRQTGGFGSTGFSLPGGGSGTYTFDAYITTGTVRQELLSFTVGPNGLISDSYDAPSDFRVSLLGSNADDPTVTPLDRLNDGTRIVGTENLTAALRRFVNPDGSLSGDLQFGFLRTDFAVPTSGNASDVLFSWHADVFTQIQATPEPAALLPLGLGTLALARRRRHA